MNNYTYITETFAIALTCTVFFLSKKLYEKYNFFLLNPVLVSIVSIIAILKFMDIPFESYNKGGGIITYLLKPAVVALGVPLYLQLKEIKKQKIAIVSSMLAGSIIGILSVILFAKIFGASKPVILSLIPKSVTTPIAIEVSSIIGGIPSLTVGIVITVGVFGSVLGLQFLKFIHVKDDLSIGLAMGAASHGIGTARVAEQNSKQGAFSGLGLILTGIFTALLAPWILVWLGKWI